MNKIIFNSAVMVAAMEQVKKVMERNPGIPILENFLIQVQNQFAIVSGSDLQTTIKARVPIESMPGTEFSGCLPVVALPYLKKLEPQPLTLVYDPGSYAFEIYDQEGRAKYAGENGEDFPKAPKADTELLTLQPEHLNELKDLLTYVSKDQLRPAMAGIHFGYHEGKLNLVATDGHMLKVVNLVELNEEGRDEPLFNLNAKVSKILNGIKEPVRVFIGANGEGPEITNVGFEFEVNKYLQVQIITRNIDEKFPEYWNVIPEKSTTKFTTESKPFLKVLDKAVMFANKTTSQVRLSINGENSLSAEDLDFSNEYKGLIPGTYEGEGIEIGFNGKFLSKLISGFGDTVTLEMTEPNRAAVVREGNSLALCMPVMLKREV